MRVDWHISAGAISAQLGALEELTLLNLNNNQLILRGELFTLVNRCPFTRVNEWSSPHIWRRRQDFCQCRRMLRGKHITLVNGYPFIGVTELSSLHIWRRRKPKSWVRTQPNPFLCNEKCVWKHFLLHTKRRKIPDEKRVCSYWETVLITYRLGVSAGQC